MVVAWRVVNEEPYSGQEMSLFGPTSGITARPESEGTPVLRFRQTGGAEEVRKSEVTSHVYSHGSPWQAAAGAAGGAAGGLVKPLVVIFAVAAVAPSVFSWAASNVLEGIGRIGDKPASGPALTRNESIWVHRCLSELYSIGFTSVGEDWTDDDFASFVWPRTPVRTLTEWRAYIRDKWDRPAWVSVEGSTTYRIWFLHSLEDNVGYAAAAFIRADEGLYR